MAQLIYILDIRARAASARFAINDVEVAAVSPDPNAVDQTVINDCLHRGENRLSVRAEPAGEGAALAYRIIRTFRAADAPEQTLAQVDRNPLTPLDASPGPLGFAVVDPLPTPAWEGADARRMSPADEPVLTGEVLRLIEAFAARDPGRIADLLAGKFEHQARAFQLSPGELREDALEHFAYLFESSDFALTPMPPERIGWRYMAQSRLAAPFDRLDGGPVIRGGSPKYELDLAYVWRSSPMVIR